MGLRTAFQCQRQSKGQRYSRPRPRLEQVVQVQGQASGLQHQSQSGPVRQGHYMWNKKNVHLRTVYCLSKGA